MANRPLRRKDRDAVPSPTRNIGSADVVGSKLDVHVLNQPPSARSATTALKRISKLGIDFTDRALMSRRRRRLDHDLAADDLRARIVRQSKQIDVGSKPLCLCWHESIVSRV